MKHPSVLNHATSFSISMFVLLGMFFSLFLITTTAYSTEADESWHTTIRMGLSTAGMLGIETQHGNFAVSVGGGEICVFSCSSVFLTAVKYYFDGTGTSWSLGYFNCSGSNCNGYSVEHRWQLNTRWDFMLGLAVIDSNSNKIPSVSFGYSY